MRDASGPRGGRPSGADAVGEPTRGDGGARRAPAVVARAIGAAPLPALCLGEELGPSAPVAPTVAGGSQAQVDQAELVVAADIEVGAGHRLDAHVGIEERDHLHAGGDRGLHARR